MSEPSSSSTAASSGSEAREAHAEALERLRTQVGRAAAEIKRLRRETARLENRIRELESNPGLNHDGTLLPLDAPPEQLRDRIERFIGAIDEQLAQSGALAGDAPE